MRWAAERRVTEPAGALQLREPVLEEPRALPEPYTRASYSSSRRLFGVREIFLTV